MKFVFSILLAFSAMNVIADEVKVYSSLESNCSCFMQQEKACDDCACGPDCDCGKK